jgi:hypothetical protein
MEANGSVVAQIHPSIVKAICTIMATMDAVKKTTRNQHGGYMFSSTDDFYAALSRKMGEVGLMCMALEDHEPEIQRIEKEGKTQQWGKFTFSFVLATEEATWADPRSRRTLFIQITGPQTFQAAQSYAEKSYYKSLFKIPSGDMDLDGLAQAETEEDQVTLNAGPPKKRKSSSASKKDGTDKVFNDILAQIENAPNTEVLQQVNVLYAAEWREMPERWSLLLSEHYEDKMDTLRQASM